MNVKKRGLGRGLEVLLADTNNPNAQDQQVQPQSGNDRLAHHLQQEQLNLLQEAESLKNLLDELADMIRGGQN